jgi:tetratricopeptide (TPR) repeat protein
MKFINTVRGVRLLALCVAVITFAACGQQEQAATEAADESTDAQTSIKIPVTTSSAEALELYNQGRSLADDLHNVRAHALFEQAVEEDPEFSMAYFMLANTAQTTADFFAAVELARASMGNASEGEQFLIRAQVAGSENDQAAQLEAIKGAMALHPQDERTHVALANYFNGQQDFAAAVTHYGHATTINPDFASAFNSLGYAHRNNDNLDGAKAAFARYVELIPDEANPYDSYAELLCAGNRGANAGRSTQ